MNDQSWLILPEPPGPVPVTKYILAVGHEAPMMFGVDRLEYQNGSWEAYRDETGLVVKFPRGTGFIMFDRALAKFVPREEYAGARWEEMCEELAEMIEMTADEKPPVPEAGTRGYL